MNGGPPPSHQVFEANRAPPRQRCVDARKRAGYPVVWLEKAMKSLAKIGLIGLLGAASAIGARVVYGDPPSPPDPANPSGANPSGLSGEASASGVSGSASVDLRGPMQMSDIRARVALMREQTRADARHMQHLQQIARQEKNVIKLNCVNDKLVQAKPEMNIADAKEAELEAAGEADRMVLFEAIATASDSLRRLREEADQCIGEPISFGMGESSNSFTGPHAPDDPTKGLPGGQIEPPAYASPYN
jgi:hypothetical protein